LVDAESVNHIAPHIGGLLAGCAGDGGDHFEIEVGLSQQGATAIVAAARTSYCP
jgi:hypothetical protein